MISEAKLRELLIESCHSSSEAEAELMALLSSPDFIVLLVKIAVDDADYQGDAPMQAAYFLSQASPFLTRPFEQQLYALLTTANGYGGHIALVLGRMQSALAKDVIRSELGDGQFPSAWLYEKALKEYGADNA
jgi:hypothetical protein